MSRTTGIAWTAAILLAAAWPLWEVARRHEPPTSAPIVPPPAPTQVDPDDAAAEEDGGCVVEESREEELPQPADALPVAAPEPSKVRVRGRVLQGGRPIAGHDLVFRFERERLPGDDDWDFTDVGGGYEVELRTGRYVIWSGDDGESWVTDVVVPEGVEELVLDLDIPF